MLSRKGVVWIEVEGEGGGEKVEEKKITLIEPETKEQPGECCVPECGPTTCEPGAEGVEAEVVEAQVVEEPKKASSGCGPSCT